MEFRLAEAPRRIVRRFACAFAAGSLLIACQSPADKVGFDELNADRTELGVPALRYNNMLQLKADKWADYLAEKGELSHSDLTDDVSGCWKGLAENVGYGPSVAAIQDAYMNSPPHRANVVNKRYDDGAVAVVQEGNRYYTVQLFLDKC